MGIDSILCANLFLLGLAGGFGHCLAMCGPFVLGQVGASLAQGPAPGMIGRIAGGALAPYHLGRATTYAALGALAGGIGGGFAAIAGAGPARAILLSLAAAMLLAQAAGLALGVGPRLGGRLAALAAPLGDRPSPVARFAFGLMLGFLPCGLVLSALAGAAGSASAVAGAAAMASFAAGTAPALIALGIAGVFAGRRAREHGRRFAPLVMAVNAVVLLWLAWGA